MTDVIVIIIGNPPPPPPREQKQGDPDGFAQNLHGCNDTPYTIARDLIDQAARAGSRIRLIYEGSP